MYSRMYPDVSEIIEFGEDKSKTKPLVLCEFVSVSTLHDGPELTFIDPRNG
jgi:beta-galactosidase